MTANIVTIGNSQRIRIPKILLDQRQTLEKARLTQKIGEIEPEIQKQILEILQEMFAE